jgi:hypothetical protein
MTPSTPTPPAKPSPSLMTTTRFNDCETVRTIVSIDPALKWGFVVFRCTYGEDEAWKKFMDHLNTHVRLKFIKDGCEDM